MALLALDNLVAGFLMRLVTNRAPTATLGYVYLVVEWGQNGSGLDWRNWGHHWRLGSRAHYWFDGGGARAFLECNTLVEHCLQLIGGIFIGRV